MKKVQYYITPHSITKPSKSAHTIVTLGSTLKVPPMTLLFTHINYAFVVDHSGEIYKYYATFNYKQT